MARDTYQKNFPDVPNTPEKYTEYINNQTILSADHMSTIRDAIQADETYLVNVDADLSDAESDIEQINQTIDGLEEQIDALQENEEVIDKIANGDLGVVAFGGLSAPDTNVQGITVSRSKNKVTINGTRTGTTKYYVSFTAKQNEIAYDTQYDNDDFVNTDVTLLAGKTYKVTAIVKSGSYTKTSGVSLAEQDTINYFVKSDPPTTDIEAEPTYTFYYFASDLRTVNTNDVFVNYIKPVTNGCFSFGMTLCRGCTFNNLVIEFSIKDITDENFYNFNTDNLLATACNVHGRRVYNGRDILVDGCRVRKWRVDDRNTTSTTCVSLLGDHFRLFATGSNTKNPDTIASFSADTDFIKIPKWLNANNLPYLALRINVTYDGGTGSNNGLIFATKNVEEGITTITASRVGANGSFLIPPNTDDRTRLVRLELINVQDETTPSFWETAISNGNLAMYFCNSNVQASTNIDFVFGIVDTRWSSINIAPIESYRAKTNHEIGDLFTMSSGRLYKTTSPIVAGSVISPTSTNNSYTTVAEQLNTKVRFDMDQTLTDTQKATARTNIGAADESLVGVELLSWDGSGYISNAVTVGTQITMEVTSNSGYRHLVADCSPGDRFTVTGCLGSAVVLYSFLDSSNTVLECDGAGSDRDHYVITAPAGSAKLLVQCYNEKYGSFGSVYKGVYTPKTIDNMASKGISRDVSLIWRDGAVTTSGFISSGKHKRTNGICFNPGERLIIQNTNKNVNIAVYASKNGVFKVIGDPAGAADAYIRGGGRFVLRDWTWTYYILLGPYSGNTQPDPVTGGYITVTVESADVPYNSGYYKLCAYPQIGLKRTYSNVKPMLTFESKTIGENGIENNALSCLVTLPNVGWVEVKQDEQKIKFKIAKLTGGVVTYLVNDWSYYSYRYRGDGQSIYYALVTATPGAETNENIMQLAHMCLCVYTYTDEGASYNNGYYLSGKHIAFIGDSITQGRFDKDGDSNLDTTMAKPFCEIVAEIAGDDNVGNYGIGGACVSDQKYSWKSLLTNCDKISGYDVVFVCGGTNDYGENIAEQDFRTAYTTVLNTLIAANTEVICCTPVYRANKTGANTAGLWLSDYAAIIRELASTNGLKCIDLMQLTSDGCFARFCPDNLHPNEMGHKVIADLIVQECDRLGLE